MTLIGTTMNGEGNELGFDSTIMIPLCQTEMQAQCRVVIDFVSSRFLVTADAALVAVVQ